MSKSSYLPPVINMLWRPLVISVDCKNIIFPGKYGRTSTTWWIPEPMDRQGEEENTEDAGITEPEDRDQ